MLPNGQVDFYPGFSGFRPPLMNDRHDISEIVLKGPKNPNQKKKKKKKKKLASILRTPICGISVM